MLLDVLARTSAEVAGTSARSAKIRLIADCLRAADAADVPIVVAYLAGELRQRRTGLGPAALRSLPPPAAEPTLTVTEVDAAFATMAGLAGAGSSTRRAELFRDLVGRATAVEQRLLAGLVAGELRQGALDGVMVEAVVAASGRPPTEVRRAVMVAGAVGPVAEAALAAAPDALAAFGLQVGRPVRPMLAQSGTDVEDALARTGPAAVEWKLDGIRIQVHRDGDDVAVFTRSLDEITGRVPEVVAAVRELPVRSVILDGEAIALRPDGRPLPFQATAARSARQRSERAAPVPLTPFFFDCLSLDGVDLTGAPASARRAELERIAHPGLLVPRAEVTSTEQAGDFLAAAIAAGHEGVVVKALAAGYDAGRRGAGWVKVKPRHTLDLVVLAAEWGHGRRRGWLSNLHLGARDPAGGFVMLGKTFKGLTDALLEWQTEQLLARAVHRSDWVVTVRPELVVEIAFDGVQTSPRYPGGVALRFARVLRYREDKSAQEADTIDAVRAIHARQG
ncbi:ATP-dependent DNA ligase [Sporichthya polymorpha]|uniref:ATP-dependent DNA ligase n=1 Tax=Sporichthya polymorpha TaxID=35751 RepID=UPI00035F2DB4|nr:ATP-dependent DNA ligase [Sporichthya polymorpha]